MLKEWIEKNLQRPFYQAEILKAQINIAESGEGNLCTVKVMAVYGAVYMSFCVYWFFKYIVA